MAVLPGPFCFGSRYGVPLAYSAPVSVCLLASREFTITMKYLGTPRQRLAANRLGREAGIEQKPGGDAGLFLL